MSVQNSPDPLGRVIIWPSASRTTAGMPVVAENQS